MMVTAADGIRPGAPSTARAARAQQRRSRNPPGAGAALPGSGGPPTSLGESPPGALKSRKRGAEGRRAGGPQGCAHSPVTGAGPRRWQSGHRRGGGAVRSVNTAAHTLLAGSAPQAERQQPHTNQGKGSAVRAARGREGRLYRAASGPLWESRNAFLRRWRTDDVRRPRDGSGGAQSPEEPRTGGGAAGPDTQACGHSRRAVFTHRGMGSGRRVYASA